jgi:V/A-type H+-transporting ATPase subunit I
MLRPRKMSYIKLTVHKNDIDNVLEYLGKQETIQFLDNGDEAEKPETGRIEKIIDRIRTCALYIGIQLPEDREIIGVPTEQEKTFTSVLLEKCEKLKESEIRAEDEKKRITETYNEANVFSNLNAPYTDIAHLSYLTLRVGRLDSVKQQTLRENLKDRAVIIPLDSNRVLAASSRKGRFALDSELKKIDFEPIAIPEGFKGIPADILNGLSQQLTRCEEELESIRAQKSAIKKDHLSDFEKIESMYITALAIEKLKTKFVATTNTYMLVGWTPEDQMEQMTKDLSSISKGRAGIRIFKPEEIADVRNGNEKVPVALKHGSFVKSFEKIVFSYGAPSYGTIDPTPMVAVFFTLLFGIMFGDVGQGFVLFLIGLLILKIKGLSKFKSYAVPLVSVGISSMIMGILNGAVFTNETLLITPTRLITQAVMGQPINRFLNILPMSEKGGSVRKMFIFFGFTISIGVILNSIGLIINIINRCIMKKYQEAFFSKTGLAGMLLFWYAVFIAVRIILGGQFEIYDFTGLFIPVFCLFFGPVIWRVIAGERPVLKHGLMTFFMEGFVEILETVSTYISNTVSFLRVGAFALSHAVLSYIVFRFSETLSGTGAVASVSALLIMILGNTIIIALEGMIVAIQVVRLQYYEFFNKFFTETGVEFMPFRFKTR